MSNYPFVGFGSFVRRQTPTSKFSHTTLSEQQVINLVTCGWGQGKPTYRKYDPATGVDEKGLKFGGVVSVPVPAEGFYTAICTLRAGDVLSGVYEARRAGEEPRKNLMVVGGQKAPARSVDIILYHADVLAEDPTNGPDWTPVAEWEIVSINASPEPEGVEVPIHPMTLLHNHFQSSGGTATGLTAEEVLVKMKESFEYWKDKALTLGEGGV